MKIAVLGYGNVARSLGIGWAKKGHSVLFGVREPEKQSVKAFLSANPGARVKPISEAIDESELITLAIPYEAAKATVETAGNLGGKIVLDCTNPIGPGLKLEVGHTTSGAEEIARRAVGGLVVKSFNTTGWENLEDSSYPGYGGHRPVMYVCGDHDEANKTVCALAEDLGFESCNWGPLEGARYLEPMAMLWIIPVRSKGHGQDFAFGLFKREREASPAKVTGDDLKAFYNAFSGSDFDFMERMLHPDCVLGFPGSSFGGKTVGRKAIMNLFKGIQQIMDGTLRFEVDWAEVVGDRGVVQFYTFGIPPQGGRYQNRGAAIYRFSDGMIIDFQDYLDTEIIQAFWPNGQPSEPPDNIEELLSKAERML